MNTRRHLALLVRVFLLSLVFFMPAARAVVWQQPVAQSHLNEPLDLSISAELSGETSKLIQQQMAQNSADAMNFIRLVPASKNAADWLSKVTLNKSLRDNTLKIDVKSTAPIQEEVLRFTVQLKAGETIYSKPVRLFLEPKASQAVLLNRPTATATKANSKAIDKTAFTRFGPTSGKETLWAVAKKVRPNNKLTVHQTMVAIFKANPEAFVLENINGLLSGQTLKVPSASIIASYPLSDTLALIKRHNGLWANELKAARLALLSESSDKNPNSKQAEKQPLVESASEKAVTKTVSNQKTPNSVPADIAARDVKKPVRTDSSDNKPGDLQDVLSQALIDEAEKNATTVPEVVQSEKQVQQSAASKTALMNLFKEAAETERSLSAALDQEQSQGEAGSTVSDKSLQDDSNVSANSASSNISLAGVSKLQAELENMKTQTALLEALVQKNMRNTPNDSQQAVMGQSPIFWGIAAVVICLVVTPLVVLVKQKAIFQEIKALATKPDGAPLSHKAAAQKETLTENNAPDSSKRFDKVVDELESIASSYKPTAENVPTLGEEDTLNIENNLDAVANTENDAPKSYELDKLEIDHFAFDSEDKLASSEVVSTGVIPSESAPSETVSTDNRSNVQASDRLRSETDDYSKKALLVSEDELQMIAGEERVETELDLVRAYVDMGEYESAKPLLDSAKVHADTAHQKTIALLEGRIEKHLALPNHQNKVASVA